MRPSRSLCYTLHRPAPSRSTRLELWLAWTVPIRRPKHKVMGHGGLLTNCAHESAQNGCEFPTSLPSIMCSSGQAQTAVPLNMRTRHAQSLIMKRTTEYTAHPEPRQLCGCQQVVHGLCTCTQVYTCVHAILNGSWRHTQSTH